MSVSECVCVRIPKSMLKVIMKLTWFKLFDLNDDSGHTDGIWDQILILKTVVLLSPAGISSEIVLVFVE